MLLRHSFSRLPLLSVFILLALVFACRDCQAKGDWVLTQRSETMGDQYVYLSPRGVKWVNPKMGANVVTCAPQWTVTLYNDKTKSYYHTTFEEWQRQLAGQGGRRAYEMKSNPWVRAGKATIAGMKATRYVMKGSKVRPPARGKRNSLRSVKQAECWLSDEITVPPKLAGMLSNAYGLPATRFFPLKVSYQTDSGKKGVALNTYRSQACKLPGSYFAAPAGYKLANSSAEVFMDDETKQMFKDMVTDRDIRQPRQAPRQAAAPAARSKGGDSINIGGITVQKSDLTKLLNRFKGGK